MRSKFFAERFYGGSGSRGSVNSSAAVIIAARRTDCDFLAKLSQKGVDLMANLNCCWKSSGAHQWRVHITRSGKDLALRHAIGLAVVIFGASMQAAQVMRRHSLIVLLASLWGCSGIERCDAGFTFLGPTPYLSAADSPFPVDGSNPYFFLEDFENDPGCIPGDLTFCGGGKFDSPGARLVYGGTTQGLSVDGDDGVVDGSGSAGASGIVSPWFLIGSEEVAYLFAVEFDATQVGFLPIALGFVLTDGETPGFNIYDAAGNRTEFLVPPLNLTAGNTSDDRFLGVISPVGIARFEIDQRISYSQPTGLLHIDHLQYGLIVPEPPTLLGLWALAIVVIYTRLSRARKKIGKDKGSECVGV